MKLPQTSLSSTGAEPKSVLDIRRSPPSPVNSTGLLSSKLPVENLKFEHGVMNQGEEWDSDSLMRELGLYDDSNKSSSLDLPELPFLYSDFETLNPNPNQNIFDLINMNEYNANEFDFRDELTRLAECFETQSFQLAQVILARLNQRLRSPNGKPLQRAVFYFKEALQTLFNGSAMFHTCTSYEIVQTIKAYRTFSTVSPIPLFSSFTANQAILDAVDGAMIVHVIDFDVGLGGQWASFLKAVAEKAEAQKMTSPAVRITAVVPEVYELESRLIRDNLYQFASELKLRFAIEFVSIREFEFASFNTIKLMSGEKTAVVLSPSVFKRIGSGFVNDVYRVSPNVVVYIDGELNGSGPSGASFFSKKVIDGLELYTTILESLEAANTGGGGEWIRSIEMFVLLPKIMAMVEDGGRVVSSWREAFGRAGLRPVGMSQFADFQAECLVRRVQVRGFHVVKQHAEMMLCWHDRPIVATSVWRF